MLDYGRLSRKGGMFLKVEFIALYVISSSKDLWIEDFWEQDGEWNSKSGKFSIKAFYSFFALKDSNVFPTTVIWNS